MQVLRPRARKERRPLSIETESAALRLRVDVNDWAARASFEEILANAPQAMRRAMSRVAGTMRTKMAKAVSKNPVARAELTRALRDKPTGGPLSKKSAIKIRWLTAADGGYGFNVDWIEPLRPYASRFMDGGPVGLANPRVRAAIHRALWYRGRKDEPVDPGAVQPPREVTEPVRKWAEGEFERSVRGALRKVFEEAAAGKFSAGRAASRPRSARSTSPSGRSFSRDYARAKMRH